MLEPSSDELKSQGYTVLRPLDAGASATVWLALKQTHGGVRYPCAVKELKLDAYADAGALDFNKALFTKEAQILSNLQHPNVVGIIDFIIGARTLYLVMTYVEGLTFYKMIAYRQALLLEPKRPRDLSLELVLAMAADALKGLNFVHTATDQRGKPLGLQHRDIKPSNLMLSSTGTVKLLDFGIAEVAQGQEGEGWLMGTPAYMSPEQAAGEPLGPQTDLYSLGLVLYEMLTLRKGLDAPPGVDPLEVARTPPTRQLLEPLRAWRRDVAELFLGLLHRDPARRFTTAQAALRAVQALQRRLSPVDLNAFYDLERESLKTWSPGDLNTTLAEARNEHTTTLVDPSSGPRSRPPEVSRPPGGIGQTLYGKASAAQRPPWIRHRAALGGGVVLVGAAAAALYVASAEPPDAGGAAPSTPVEVAAVAPQPQPPPSEAPAPPTTAPKPTGGARKDTGAPTGGGGAHALTSGAAPQKQSEPKPPPIPQTTSAKPEVRAGGGSKASNTCKSFVVLDDTSDSAFLTVNFSAPPESVKISCRGSPLLLPGSGNMRVRLHNGTYQLEARRDGKITLKDDVSIEDSKPVCIGDNCRKQ